MWTLGLLADMFTVTKVFIKLTVQWYIGFSQYFVSVPMTPFEMESDTDE